MKNILKMHKSYLAVLLSLITVTAGLNILSRISTDFADWHRKYVFPFWQTGMSLISNAFIFSIGEFLIGAAVILLLASFIVLMLLVISGILKLKRKFYWAFLRGIVMLAAIVAFIMTETCFILYQSSGLKGEYLSDIADKEYSFEELAKTRDFIVEQANALSKEIERDEDGNPVFNGDMNAEALDAMYALSGEWDEFSGIYSLPKQLFSSELMCQQSMRGYYFPFTMEANYNCEMTTLNFPSTICHELAHTKGFMKEDEANFIAYIACINSKNKFFQYSGYLSVLNYINNDFKEACEGNEALYSAHESISSAVKSDNVFLTEETEEKVEKNAVISTAKVKKTAKSFIDTNLVVNGVPEGSVSYSNVVGQLLYWYNDDSQFLTAA